MIGMQSDDFRPLEDLPSPNKEPIQGRVPVFSGKWTNEFEKDFQQRLGLSSSLDSPIWRRIIVVSDTLTRQSINAME